MNWGRERNMVVKNGSRHYLNNIQPYAYLIPMISLRLNQYFSDFCNLKKKKQKQKQISKIEKTNILIENPKTQNKNKSNLNLMVYQKCTSRFVQKGRLWEGTEEIRHEKRARPQLPCPSLIKDEWAYWILQAWSMLVLNYLVHPW